jgi:hypothetical protein
MCATRYTRNECFKGQDASQKPIRLDMAAQQKYTLTWAKQPVDKFRAWPASDNMQLLKYLTPL